MAKRTTTVCDVCGKDLPEGVYDGLAAEPPEASTQSAYSLLLAAYDAVNRLSTVITEAAQMGIQTVHESLILALKADPDFRQAVADLYAVLRYDRELRL